MKHQYIVRLSLGGVCLTFVGLTLFSTGQAQDAITPVRSAVPGIGSPQPDPLGPTQPANVNPANSFFGSRFGRDDPRTSQTYEVPRAQTSSDAGINSGGNPIGTSGPATSPKVENSEKRLQDAIGGFKRAKDDEARKKALHKLSEVVSQIFDEDLKRRESEVNGIRQRVSRLKALIEKRKESKDRIVDLQLKIQLNEVEGLGFSVKRNGRSRGVDPYYGGVVYPDVTNPGVAGMAGAELNRYGQVLGLPGGNPYGGGTSTESENPLRKAERALRDVTKKLKLMKGEYDREDAEALLRPALESYFAADLTGREQEINGIQKRIDNLEKLIEQRREARDQVIALQVEVLKNDAEGLGFFSTSSGGSDFRDGFRVSIPAGGAPGMFGFRR